MLAIQGRIGAVLFGYRIAAVFILIAFSYASARAQTAEQSSVPDTIRHLPGKPVEITAQRPGGLATVDARGAEIKPTAALTTETGSHLASDALRAMSSSLDVRSYGSLGSIAIPSFRGLPAEYTTVYRDGIRITNEQLGETDLGQLTLHGISRVELIPASTAILLGGDAIGATIDLISEVRDSNDVTLGSEQTTYDGSSGIPTQSYYAKASLNPLPSLSIVAGGSLDESTGAFPFFQDSTHPNVLRTNNDAALRNANVAALWAASSNTAIRLIGNYFYEDRGSPGGISTEGVGASLPSARQTDAQLFGALKADHEQGPLAWSLSTGLQRQFESYRDPAYSTFDSAWNTMFNASAHSSYLFNEEIQAFGGVEAEHTTLAGNTNESPNGDSIISRERTSAYAAAKLLPFENLDVTGSLRFETISDLSISELLPQATIKYSPLHDLVLGAAYSSSFHAPTLNDLYWSQGGNANLKPERGDNWQTSISFEPNWHSMAVRVSATGFLATIENEIIWLPYIGQEYSPINIGKVESKGIEFRANADLSLGERSSVHIEESYTWLQARNITAGDRNYGNEIPYSSPTCSLFIAEFTRSEYGSLSLLVRYRGHEFSDPANNPMTMLQPVTTYDVTVASREFTFDNFGGKLNFSIVDLTNEHYEEVINYPLPSRSYHFSIELSYH